MSLAACKTQLVTAVTNLLSAWAHTKTQWQDAKQLEFEQTLLEELQPLVNSAVEAIDALEQLTKGVRRDCEH